MVLFANHPLERIDGLSCHNIRKLPNPTSRSWSTISNESLGEKYSYKCLIGHNLFLKITLNWSQTLMHRKLYILSIIIQMFHASKFSIWLTLNLESKCHFPSHSHSGNPHVMQLVFLSEIRDQELESWLNGWEQKIQVWSPGHPTSSSGFHYQLTLYSHVHHFKN